MDTRGAADLGARRGEPSAPTLALGRFHDPAIAKLAAIAADLNAEMYQGGWVNLLNWSYPEQGMAVTAKNTYTTMTDIVNPQRAFIPAGSLNVGSILRISAWGTSGSAAGTAAATMALYLNGAASGVQMSVTAAQTPATSTVNCWWLEAQATILTIGSSGTVSTMGNVVGINATAATTVLMPATLPAAATINTTQANGITLAVSWNAGAAGNTFSVYGFTVEQLN